MSQLSSQVRRMRLIKKAARAPEGDDGRLETVIESEAIKLHYAGQIALITGVLTR